MFLCRNRPCFRPVKPFLRHLRSVAWPAVAGLALLALFACVRERLVPAGADFDRSDWLLTGDEPAYLLTAQAIASGDGEDVSRVREARTWKRYTPRHVIGRRQWTWSDYKRQGCPHLIDRSAAWGETRQVIQRPPLIAVFAAPFALRPSGARRAVLGAHVLFAALAAFALALLAVRSGAPGPWAAWGVVCLLGSMPIVYYTAEIYPEILVGSLAALALMLCRSPRPPLRAAAIALLVVSLWGTGRVVPAVAAVTALLAWRELRARNRAAVAVFLAGWAAYLAYNLNLWGHVVPPTPPDGGTLTFATFRLGILANFLGNDFGLFLLCPAAVVGAWALAQLVLRHRDDPATWPCLLYACLVAAVVASFSHPRAGTCPAGRYQVAQAFAFLVPILVLCAREPAGSPVRLHLRFLLLTLGIPSLAAGLVVAFHPGWWFARYHPLFKLDALGRLYGALPDFEAGSWALPFLCWIAFFGLLLFPWPPFRVRRERPRPAPEPADGA